MMLNLFCVFLISQSGLKYIGDRNIKTVDKAKAYISSQKLLEKLRLKLNGTTRIPNDDELLLYEIEKPI
jgi:hypothetical protein